MATVRLRARVDSAGARRLVERAVRACEPPSITDSLEAGAEVWQEGARRRAPHQSGALAASIVQFPAGAYAVEVGSELIYAAITEFGGTIRPLSRSKRARLKYADGGATFYDTATRVPAQPYLLPTFEQDSDEVVDAVGDAIAAAIGG